MNKKENLYNSIFITQLILFLNLIVEVNTAQAYVGPGAGFAFLGSALVFVITILMAIATLAFWPLQWFWRKITNKDLSKKARARRVIIVGLDGLDPKLARQYMEKGLLPNFSALAKEGGFYELATTIPSIS
ncbi:MAG: nucleotide pyrophosphatase, partial [SAR324 cluster bacterium]|nr:nucleotide pyrophosphatase [SAR324 cluster bacterium]